MRGRNEQPNRTKWTYLASPRINKQQQMTAYVRPFLRRRFHRSGSRSVKDPPSPPPPPPSPPSRFRDFTSVFLSLSYSLSFSLSLRTERERESRENLLFRHSSAFFSALTRSWTARGDPPCGGPRGPRGSFARPSLPIAGFVVTFTSVSIFRGREREIGNRGFGIRGRIRYAIRERVSIFRIYLEIYLGVVA